MRNKGHTNVLSINIGTYETAPERREAYIKAARAARFSSLGSWCKAVLDKAAKHKPKEKGRWPGLICAFVLAGSVAHASDYDQRKQANALERIAQAEEIRNATATPNRGSAEDCPNLWPGRAVPEGCQLRLDPRKQVEGPDGKYHIAYLLYCPNE